MAAKTSDEGFHKSWNKHIKILLVLIIFGAIVFSSVPASATVYYLENNATTTISVGADGTINYVASGGLITPVYKNLLNMTAGATQVNLRYTTTVTTEVELFRYYLPFNYSTSFKLDANTAGKINWRAVGVNDKLNVSLVNYFPNNGTKIVLGNATFTTTGGATATVYSFTIPNPQYTVPAGNRLMLRINTTTPTAGAVRLYDGDTTSYIDINEVTYNLSGYVTNKSSGLPISGTMVQTNTSLSATTNDTGFYTIANIPKGTYNITASTLVGYASNYTVRTITAADITGANISLSPVPTYQLSGYVTNQSSGAVIPGAIVTLNNTLSTTTDNAGFYDITVNNGTYIITASKPAYSDNSTTRTVIGASVSSANISLIPTAGKIIVATNRYVILDDPRKPAGAWADTASGFALPLQADYTTWNYWSGINTIINATALYIDNNGMPVAGKTISFTLYRADDTALTTVNDTTNLWGLANFSYDLNGANYYGNWKVRAANGSLNDSTSFIYNWWGCSYTGSLCNFAHSAVTTGATANSPYLSGRDRTTGARNNHYASTTNCTFCHQSFDGRPGDTSPTNPDSNHLNTPPDVHRTVSCDNASCHGNYDVHGKTTTTGNMVIASCYNATGGCHASRADVSGKSTLNNPNVQTALSLYSYNNGSSFNATFHTPNSTVPCIICHGPMHNITKPDASQGFIRNTDTESSQCTSCHAKYDKHNLSIGCTLCHSDDVHAIQVLAQNATYVNLNHDTPNPARGNCTSCHQSSTFFNILKALPDAGVYTGRNPPQIPTPLNHSIDPVSGALWNGTQSGYWDNTSQLSACNYCHGSTLHTASALGSIGNVKGINNLNQSLASGTWCANCHYKNAPGYGGNQFSPQPPEVLNQSGLVPAISRDGTAFYNHSSVVSSSYDDATCKSCHDNKLNAGAKSLDFSHNVGIGQAGGANCTNCHNIGGSAGTGKLVNISAMNDTNAIHRNLNSGATTALPEENKKCWACHGNGSEPSGGHPSTYKTPYKCPDCHVPDVGQNLNFTPKNTILNVTQHYWNGTKITTSGVTSCYSCHNKTEMMLGTNIDPDGSASVYGGANGGSNSSSHYGKKRTDMAAMDNYTYCSYCHNTTTNNDTFYVSDYNNSIYNHTSRATTPLCGNCHNAGRIHNSTLVKPVSNDTLCKTCHGPGGSASTNNKAEHKTLYCTECHANNTAGTQAGNDIHSIKYLTQGNTFATTNSSAVNCVTCHQTANVDTSLAGFSPLKITNPLHHSDNANNGSVWGSYWINTTPQTACIYCHGDTKHNSTPIGRILEWSQNYRIFGSIGANISCADCHYRGDSNYTQMNSTYVSAGLPVPPEITNGTSWNGRSSNYYNHSFSTYADQDCKSCHGSQLSVQTNMSEFTHKVATGVAGGANCTNCHNIGGSAGAGKLVNISAMNDTNAIHRDLNSGATTALPEENKKCWACHGNGSEPASGHPSRYKTPYNCTDCHISAAGQNLNFTPNNTLLTVIQHYWNGTNITTTGVTSCYSCHNRTEMMLGINIDPDGAAGVYDGANGGSNSSSHYGRKRTDMAAMDTTTYCTYCHNTTTNNATFYVSEFNNTIYNHTSRATTPLCGNCHNAGRIHNSTLEKPVSNDTLCKTCHGTGGSALTNNKTEHKTLYCTECHANSSMGTLAGKEIHGIKYLTQSNNFASSNSSAVNCTTCHQTIVVDSSLSGFTPPKVPAPMNHSTNIYNGSLWNSTPGYWANTSQQSACDYCHGKSALHNASALGNVSKIQGSNAKNQSLTGGYWCVNCHYANAANYSGNLLTPQPPEVINKSGIMPQTARDGTKFFNHSGNLASSYDDATCMNCHNSALATGATSLNFSHDVKPGGGGTNCISCHDISGNGAPGDRRINVSSMKLGVHQNLNRNAINTTVIDPINKACWACHGDGSQPTGHPANYTTPDPCEYCHVNDNFNATPVYQHYPGSVFSGRVVYDKFDPNRTCVSCHNNSLVANQNVSYGSYTEAKLINASVSHYAVNRSFGESMPSAVRGILPNTRAATGTNFGCNKCHNTGGVGKDYGNARILPSSHNKMGSTGVSCQFSCHNSNPQVNITLHDKNIGMYLGINGCYSSGCHIQPGTGGRRKR